MDGLHEFSSHDALGDEPIAGVDEDAAIESPLLIGQDERRMQVRAYNFWAGLLGDQPFPSVASLTESAAPDFANHAVLLKFDRGMDNPAIAWLGEQLADECDTNARTIRAIKRLSDVPGRSLLSRITDHYMQIIANRAPIGFEAEFINLRGVTVLYRGILLPFSSDGASIDHVYGVINWKEVADQGTTDALLAEIGKALGHGGEKAPRRPIQLLTDWADGPAAVSANDDGIGPLELTDIVGNPLDFTDEASFGTTMQDADHATLADWLASARDLAQTAHSSEDRTRAALYGAISRAWDFALAAAEATEEFNELIEDAGLTRQDRAPMTPVVKLVFGAAYDKTRLTEYAAALLHAQRLQLGRGVLLRFLSDAPGGLKGVVAAERRLRREAAGRATHDRSPDALAAKLRKLPEQSLGSINREGEEFALVLVRRIVGSVPVLLGEVLGDPALVEKAARRLIG
ncbi:hypothetical protein [Novosphingobium sp.]|uniref:hypothetical protein n=1 Tax=Novosphingobium sp. TaxID=1874826 RepID=UPI0025E806C1|nr:hypothetical protein [Novosphingobium sp.]